jgi:hypothetical protein
MFSYRSLLATRIDELIQLVERVHKMGTGFAGDLEFDSGKRLQQESVV